MEEEALVTEEQRIRNHALDMFYATCGYTPSEEISELLKNEENIFPEK